MNKKIYLILIVLIFITGCVLNEVKIDSYAVEEGDINVYFCPDDNCSSILVDFVDSGSVDCAFYDLELDEVIEALNRSNVRLVMDHSNYIEFNFSRKNKESTWGLMHNKFCVKSDKVITGSFNPTYNGNYKNNNNLIVIQSKLLADNYKREFEEMWNGKFGGGDKVGTPVVDIGFKIENYFCPEDDCALEIVNELNNAKESIYFMTFSFTHDNIANALVLAHNNSVEVKGIFEKSGVSKYSKHDFLEFQGINYTFDSNKGKMHHKVFIIDEKIVITGSMNPSGSGDERNDENILIIHSEEIASLFLNEFEKIYK